MREFISNLIIGWLKRRNPLGKRRKWGTPSGFTHWNQNIKEGGLRFLCQNNKISQTHLLNFISISLFTLYIIKELPGSKKHNSSNLFPCPHSSKKNQLIQPFPFSFILLKYLSFYWYHLAFYSEKEYMCLKNSQSLTTKRGETTNASLLINFSSIIFSPFSDLSQDR